jgi:hypothetical protein
MYHAHHNVDEFPDVDQEKILQHLDSIYSCQSNRLDDTNSEVIQCLANSNFCGLYKISNETPPNNVSCTPESNIFEAEVNLQTVSLEHLWQSTYGN